MTEPVSAYTDAVDLHEDLLGWSRLLVKRLVLRKPAAARPSEDGKTSLWLQAGAARALMEGEEELSGEDSAALAAADLELRALWVRIERRMAASAEAGVDLPLERLRGFFSLEGAEVRVVAALLAPELDPDAWRLYRWVRDDYSRRMLDVALLADLLGPDLRSRDQVRRLLGPGGSLRRHRLVTLGAERIEGEEIPLSRRTARVARRVVDFLRGDDQVEESLIGLCELVPPVAEPEELDVPDEVRDQLRRSMLGRGSGSGGKDRRPGLVLLQGPAGVGKRSLVQGLATELERPFLRADLGAIFEDPRPTEDLLALIMREAALMGGVLYLSGDASLPEEVSRPIAARVAHALDSAPGPTFLGLTVTHRWLNRALPSAARIRVAVPDTDTRARLWDRFLPRGVRRSSSVDLPDLSDRYGLTGGAIRGAAQAAAARARRRSARSPTVTQADLDHCARDQVMHKLGTLANRITPRFGWADLILPNDERDRLAEIVAYAAHRRQVYEEWGFESKVPYGTGLSALFSGPPGTGKTMAAGIVARELGLELFKIDLSRIVDRYIGETEKNLGRLFDEATEAKAILLFDEADSLFSKRTAVRSSVDRYANLEVNYLLQRMEDFEGVTILTTNFDAAFDDAFRRRIKFHVSFPFPEADARKQLWRSMFPRSSPLAPDLTWDKIAQAFEMSGGHIKNAALRAAFLAAERGAPAIDEGLINEAARLEYREMGKLVRE